MSHAITSKKIHLHQILTYCSSKIFIFSMLPSGKVEYSMIKELPLENIREIGHKIIIVRPS
jgi:hypothetical protein